MADNVKTVLDFLKQEGVAVSDAAIAAAERQFSGRILAPADRVLADGEVKESEAFHREKTQDLQRLKEENRKLIATNKDLEDSLVRGDKVNSAKLETALKENATLKAIAERFMATQRARWAAVEKLKADGKLPEQLHTFYTWPEEGKQLDDDAVQRNVAKYEEHVAIGAIKTDGTPALEALDAPRSSPAAKIPAGSEAAWRGLNPSEKIAYGYAHPAKDAATGK